jgi:hypothetical protein
VLVAACYGGILFRGGQFAFRDAANFYYPLYARVQQEWASGRLPLWEPGEDGGRRILGNPMAAVLYLGKFLFALVPYPWGVRLYTVAHELLAFCAMVALMRCWSVSRTGAALAGLCYAFSGPIVTNYFNISPMGGGRPNRPVRLQPGAVPRRRMPRAGRDHRSRGRVESWRPWSP